jgi:deoxyribodipyrimidine photo-lyase
MNELMTAPLILYWVRQDLRLSDNPALSLAAQKGTVLPLYIQEDADAGDAQMGAASKVWRHHALESLNAHYGGRLRFMRGKAETIFAELATLLKPACVVWNRCYEPWRTERDTRIKAMLRDQGIEVVSENGSLLWEPWQIKKEDGTPYRVFTPFFRRGCLNAAPPRHPLPAPQTMELYEGAVQGAIPLEALELLPRIRWDMPLAAQWNISEPGAQARLHGFLAEGLTGYKVERDFPAKAHTSRLSPYLHHGQISPHQVWAAAQMTDAPDKDKDHFLSELGWREFSYSLLYHNPDLPTRNMQAKFDAFPWGQNEAWLQAWQRGKTGIPIVDAGMRELYATGYMHNRVRMIVGSFLVKNLLLDWRHGERWFWDCLCDADMANNAASWQWVAGCGADAAPYFRIFNAVTQSQKFDPDGAYIRRYVPELARLKTPHLYAPWDGPKDVVEGAGIVLGKHYPLPLVDLSASRERALAAFAALKE